MEDINKYLNDDASEEERTAATRLREGFTALRIQDKVKTAAAARAKQRRRNNTIGLLLLLLTLSIAAWLWFSQKQNTPPSLTEEPKEQKKTLPTAPPPVDEEPAIEIEEEVPPVEVPQRDVPVSPPKEIPIARAELPPPAYGAPETYLRGQTEQKEGKELLDQLWYTGYPLTGLQPGESYLAVDELLRERTFTTAYVRLQRLDRQLAPNDTLRYLQAYTLLEMGQGQEALTLLNQLETPPSSWLPQVQWYRGLAALLADEKATAMGIFKKIAKKINHPYQQHAKKALAIYK